MNSIIILLFGLLIVHLFFSTLPYVIPNVDPSLYIPYKMWIYALTIFFAFLPSSIGTYVYAERARNV